MKNLTCFLAILWLAFPALFAQNPVLGDPSELPYTIEIEDVTQDELSGLHSAAFAQWEGWWVFIGGRVGGLHGFFPFTAFPENEANANIWLIDPETGDAHTFGVDVLNIPFHDPLKATNPQYAQDGEFLYICGGYGKDAATGDFITHDVLTAVKLPELVSAMLGGTNPSGAFRQIKSDKLRVCGGEMDKLGAYFYLVGGHDFSGNYTQTPSPSFSQTYTYEIRKFKITNTANTLALTDYSFHHDEQNLRRRDFTLAPLMNPDGSPGLCLYGGVFRPDVDLPYYNPVYITENQVFALDNTYEQVFSQYTCPAVPIFDSSDGSMYTLFFAGLSAHYFDQGSQTVKYDERVPFIRDISTFHRKPDGTSQEFLMPQKMDELLGANMIFALDENAPHFENEVLKLHEMQGKTMVGWLFGGIKAEIPNITPSSASKRMFKVFVTPKNSVHTGTPTAASDLLQMSPNPICSGQKIHIELLGPVRNVLLINTNGVILGRFGNDEAAIESQLEQMPAGVCFLQIIGENGYSLKKVVKI